MVWEQVIGIYRTRLLRALEASSVLFTVNREPLLAVRSNGTRIKQNVDLTMKCRGMCGKWKT